MDPALWAPTDYVAITGLTFIGAGRGDPRGGEGIIQGMWWSADGHVKYGGTSSPRVTIASIADGTSNTIMIGERPPPAVASDGYGAWEGNIVIDGGVGVAGTELWVLSPTGANSPSGQCPSPALFGPYDLINDCAYNNAGSFHTGGANFAFGDGSVKFISYSISRQTLMALSTRAGGEVIDASQY
jgi:prepilin-type processing-associated H-X9-DG protein